MAGKSPLSDWELAEMEHYYRHGWTSWELAGHYGVSVRTVDRIMRQRGVAGRPCKGDVRD